MSDLVRAKNKGGGYNMATTSSLNINKMPITGFVSV